MRSRRFVLAAGLQRPKISDMSCDFGDIEEIVYGQYQCYTTFDWGSHSFDRMNQVAPILLQRLLRRRLVRPSMHPSRIRFSKFVL